jgi:hypothetical protein
MDDGQILRPFSNAADACMLIHVTDKKLCLSSSVTGRGKPAKKWI